MSNETEAALLAEGDLVADYLEELLDIADLKLPNGGRLRLSVENVGPASLRDLAELFEVLSGVTEQDGQTIVELEIAEVDDSCVFLQELRKGH